MGTENSKKPPTSGPMFWFLVMKNKITELATRFLRDGFRSGSVCLYVNLVNVVRRIQNGLLARQVECPCCGWEGHAFKHLDCGKFSVPNAVCPQCRAHERHRMLHLFLTRQKPAFMVGSGHVLHFAPEQQIRSFIDENPALTPIGTDWIMQEYALRPGFSCDIHHLAAPDNTFDGLYCIHVLEHVKDDRAAIQELHRVLKPGAEAVIMVPFMMNQTETEEYDEPDPAMFDHVRGYSPLDFKDRLTPFEYEEITPESLLDPDEALRFKIANDQAIYLCRKTAAS